MAYTDPLLAMSDALYGVLAMDSTLSTLAPGGVYFDVPQNPQFPFIWLELVHERNWTGYNAKPGRGSRPEVQLRVHVFQSDYGTAREAQLVVQRIVDLLWNDAALLTADGFEVFCGQPLPELTEVQLRDQVLDGVKVKEFVLLTNYIIEEAVA